MLCSPCMGFGFALGFCIFCRLFVCSVDSVTTSSICLDFCGVLSSLKNSACVFEMKFIFESEFSGLSCIQEKSTAFGMGALVSIYE